MAGAAGSTFVHCPAATSVFSTNAPMPSAGDSTVPSVSVIFCVALNVVKQYHGLPAQAAAARAAHGAPVEDDEVAGRDVGDAVADRLDDAGGLVAEQEREVVVDAALAVVQVGVAHAARLDLDDGLARPGIGDDDRLDRHRLALRRAPRLHEPAVPLQPPCQRPAGRPRAEITRRAVRDDARVLEHWLLAQN